MKTKTNDNGGQLFLAVFGAAALFWAFVIMLILCLSEMHSCWDLMPG